MSTVETVVFVASGILFLVTWIPWVRRAAALNPIALPPRIRFGLLLAPIVCILFSLVILLTLADKAVRHNPLYLAFYLTLTMALLGAAARLFPLLGLGFRDGGIEGGNVPAFIAVSAALFGATATLAGANMGAGPGLLAVLFTAFLLVALFFAAWFAVERLTSVSRLITAEQNRAAAVRLAGFLAALGILTGWIGAGDWVSYVATLRDALVSLPAIVVLCLAFVVTEKRCRQKKFAPSAESTLSLVAALLFVVLTCAWLTLRGIL